ncbi:hypothetical protein P168DRAFT_318863 [Aspergillus campestris IBT 28561]|uniref:Uncharacterized protein n=1 Tax=Aspergillus campestris (strain IBT 28561) TaxID=1392248 RepID=A0A2I1D3U7_ASPC2|nr:uncharacterized protein P168DRAFT_318863 [Aspergillus campestris IBT 28561]PKY04540.1 hypothetical protein P168DRAFT_318863 [Aspergillus campestris IBT 28561]
MDERDIEQRAKEAEARECAERGARVHAFLEAQSSIMRMMDELEAKVKQNATFCALVNGALCLHEEQDEDAEAHARRALEIAEAMQRRSWIVLCRYWLGRIEYQRGNTADAYEHFVYVNHWIKDSPEAEDLPFYLDHCDPLGPQTESQALPWPLQQGDGPALCKKCQQPMDEGDSPDDSQKLLDGHDGPRPAKRTLGPSLEDDTTVLISQPRRDGTSPARAKPWVVQDREDQHLHPGDEEPVVIRRPGRKHRPDLELSWSMGSTPSPHRLEQAPFTFRMYPTGVAARTRPTKVFKEHPNEVLMPAKEWETIRKDAKDKWVTMSLLAHERDHIQQKILEKKTS